MLDPVWFYGLRFRYSRPTLYNKVVVPGTWYSPNVEEKKHEAEYVTPASILAFFVWILV